MLSSDGPVEALPPEVGAWGRWSGAGAPHLGRRGCGERQAALVSASLRDTSVPVVLFATPDPQDVRQEFRRSSV